ncbi:MAG: hypothetical protein PHW72_03450 [Candidatus Pacebacteria bacterium]|nr:hypothetical protein [Candidatus Paceibacterota bacterium]
MNWLAATLISYSLFAFTALIDRYILTKLSTPPKVYAFYVALLSTLVLAAAPFVAFFVPSLKLLFLCLATGMIFIFFLYWLYRAEMQFEVSRVVPAIGGLVPLFTFGLSRLFYPQQEEMSLSGMIAFLVLIIGSVIVSLNLKKRISIQSLKYSTIAAFLTSLVFILSKEIFSSLPFWTGMIWKSLGGIPAALILLSFKDVRKAIFFNKNQFPKKKITALLANQVLGGTATIIQNWAIALSPIIYLPFINALAGFQYILLLVFSVLISFKLPGILKEELDRKTVFQKSIGILLIIGGLFLLNV